MTDRRRLLLSLAGGLALSGLPSIDPLRAARRRPGVIALLLPLTGDHAALGLAMQRAAAMVQAPRDPAAAAAAARAEPALLVLDTGGTPAGAAAAAQQALRRGAAIVLGPLVAAEVRPVVAAVAGRAPVLAFSNDETLRDSGAFLIGITPTQAVEAILGYARSRGIRRLAIRAEAGEWAERCGAVAGRLAGDLGIAIVAAGAGVPDADALLVPGGAAALAAAARTIAGSGVQLLGTVQAADAAPGAVAGAWIAAPPPGGFGDFARDYEARNGRAPGAVAALAYDAAAIARTLAQRDALGRAGLLQPQGFTGVTGAVRFREDGSAQRTLAILVAGADGWAPAAA